MNTPMFDNNYYAYIYIAFEINVYCKKCKKDKM